MDRARGRALVEGHVPMKTRRPFARARAIEQSLAAFATRCADPAPIVYTRVFTLHPGVEDQFQRDTRGFIRGEMLSRAFEVILDYVDDRLYADAMIGAELVTHDGYHVPRDVFVSFFGCIRDAVRETLGAAWTADVEEAWEELLVEFGMLVGVAPRDSGAA